jgi:hypothetical protein
MIPKKKGSVLPKDHASMEVRFSADRVVRLFQNNSESLVKAIRAGDPARTAEALVELEELNAWIAQIRRDGSKRGRPDMSAEEWKKYQISKHVVYDPFAWAPEVQPAGRVRTEGRPFTKPAFAAFQKLGIQFISDIEKYTMADFAEVGNCSKVTLHNIGSIAVKYGYFFKPDSPSEQQHFSEMKAKWAADMEAAAQA